MFAMLTRNAALAAAALAVLPVQAYAQTAPTPLPTQITVRAIAVHENFTKRR